MSAPAISAVAEAGVGAVGGTVVETALDTVKTVIAKSVEFVVPPLLLPGLIKELYRYAMMAPSIENDNLVDPNAGLEAFKAFIATASLLSAIGVDEVVEILTEGVGEAVSDAIRHIVSEPFEKVFSAYRGNREIDEDEIADGYSYGVVEPEVLGAMMIMNGYSSTSTMLMVSKSVGMMYSGDIQEVASVVDGLSARAMEAWIDPWELALSMSRSVLNGIDEAVRTEADRILSELRQVIGRALDRLRDAYVNLAKASNLYGVDNIKADGYAGVANSLLDEVQALIETFDLFSSEFADPVLADLLDRAGNLIEEAYQNYWDAIQAYIDLLATLVRPLMEYVAEVGVIAYQEISRAMQEIARYRDYVPQVPVPTPGEEPGARPGDVVVNVIAIH